jgi:hypothetical protein
VAWCIVVMKIVLCWTRSLKGGDRKDRIEEDMREATWPERGTGMHF